MHSSDSAGTSYMSVLILGIFTVTSGIYSLLGREAHSGVTVPLIEVTGSVSETGSSPVSNRSLL